MHSQPLYSSIDYCPHFTHNLLFTSHIIQLTAAYKSFTLSSEAICIVMDALMES